MTTHPLSAPGRRQATSDRPSRRRVAGAAAAGFLVVASFQVALAVGAPFGRAAFGGADTGTLSLDLRLVSAVAAVVLGGVSLTGGIGGLLGPILAVLILRTVRLDLTLLSVDPNVTTIIEGTIMAVVVMLGGLLAMRRRT